MTNLAGTSQHIYHIIKLTDKLFISRYSISFFELKDMEDQLANSIYKERQFFLSKLKSNPIFFIQHLPSLSNIIYRMAVTKIFKKKKCPPWLNHLKIAFNDNYSDFQISLTKLPIRQIKHISYQSEKIDNKNENLDIHDIENYLAENRWGELIKNIYNSNSVDKLNLPKDIQQWLLNPPAKNDPAWETYSACERVANLLTYLSFIPHKTSIISPEIHHFLQDSILWIFNHLEYYQHKTGNHILNNARALMMGGVILNNQSAIKAAMIIFRHMLPVLIQNNGALRERSTHYQLIILIWLLDSSTFAKQSKFCSQSDIEFIDGYIHKMIHLAAQFCDARGYLQTFIGDISPDASPIDTVKRLMICYPDFWPMNQNSLSKQVNYDDWYILENQSQRVLLNCPSGKYPTNHPSHAHGDILSFVWFYENQAMLIDCGRFRYTKDKISTQQKSAVSHNLPLVNGLPPLCESFVITGHWWPTPYAKAKIEILHYNKTNIAIKHDGFKRATPVKIHERHIEIMEHEIHIHDRYAGKGKAEIILIWQLHPSFIYFDKSSLQITNHKQMIEIDFKQMNLCPQVEYISNVEQANWYSPEYGQAFTNPMLLLKWNVNLPFTSLIKFKVKPCAA